MCAGSRRVLFDRFFNPSGGGAIMAFYERIFENGIKGNLASGLALGVGATIFAPVLLGALSSVTRPLIKGVLKGGLILFNKGKEGGVALFKKGTDMGSDIVKEMKDLASEAQSEIKESQKKDPVPRSPRTRAAT